MNIDQYGFVNRSTDECGVGAHSGCNAFVEINDQFTAWCMCRCHTPEVQAEQQRRRALSAHFVARTWPRSISQAQPSFAAPPAPPSEPPAAPDELEWPAERLGEL